MLNVLASDPTVLPGLRRQVTGTDVNRHSEKPAMVYGTHVVKDFRHVASCVVV